MAGVTYYGDFAEDDTVLIPFNTFDSNDPAASVTVTNLADADIKVHKDGGTTQIATDGATVAIDYDGITGNHLITIDTSAHADYSTGSEYAVRIEGVTVDGGTINAWVGCFSIERAGGVLALLKTSGLSSDNKLQVDVAEWNDVPLSTTNPLPNAAADAAGGLPISDAGGLDMDTLDSNVSAILTDTSTTLDNLVDDLESRLGTPSDFGSGTSTIAANLQDLADNGTATFDRSTDSLQALRDLLTGAHTEPSGVPAANESPLDKIGYLFMALRNKVTVTSSKKQFYDDSDNAEWEKDLTDDGTTYTETEGNSV